MGIKISYKNAQEHIYISMHRIPNPFTSIYRNPNLIDGVVDDLREVVDLLTRAHLVAFVTRARLLEQVQRTRAVA